MKEESHSGLINVSTAEGKGGSIVVNSEYCDRLTLEKLHCFDEIWSFSEGEVVKQTSDRTVTRVPLCAAPLVHGEKVDVEPESLVIFIKKHEESLNIWQRLLFFLNPSLFKSEGLKEFENFLEFRQKGLKTVIPVAAGMRFTSLLHVESFLITRDYAPFVDLEELVLNRPLTLLGMEQAGKRKNILRAIALYARQMHDAGLNQKDFNATHVLLFNLEAKHPAVSLFDLQRVDKNVLNRVKWPIKAFSELNYTLPEQIFSKNEREYLFQQYLGKRNLSFFNRLQLAWIRKKTARIARHSRKRNLAPKMS